MSRVSWMETVATAQQAGPALSSFTTAVTALPPEARHTILPDDWFLGKMLRVHASGSISNVVTSQPTFTFQFQLGTTSNITAWSSGAITTTATAHTTVPWFMDVVMTCRSVGTGTGTTLMGIGTIASKAFLASGTGGDATTGNGVIVVPTTTPAVGSGFDVQVANISDLFVACSVSNAGNAIQVHQYALEVSN